MSCALHLHTSAELTVKPFDGVCGSQGFPLQLREPKKREEPVPGLLKALNHLRAFGMPLSNELGAKAQDCFGVWCVHHLLIVGLELLVHGRRGVTEHVSLLMYGAALDHAVRPHLSQ